MFNKKIRTMWMTGALVLGPFLLGCSSDVIGAAARSSLTSFAQTLANNAISAVINP